jgi:hypothetical protein
MGNATQAWSGDPSRGRATPEAAPAAEATDDAVDHMRNAGPGWYYDPDDEAIYRYWDGERWTDHRSDTVLSEVPS